MYGSTQAASVSSSLGCKVCRVVLEELRGPARALSLAWAQGAAAFMMLGAEETSCPWMFSGEQAPPCAHAMLAAWLSRLFCGEGLGGDEIEILKQLLGVLAPGAEDRS